MGEPWQHGVWNEPVTKGQNIAQFDLYKVPRVCRFIDTIAEWGRRGGELLNEFNVSVVNIENTMMDRMVEHYECLIPLICTFLNG